MGILDAFIGGVANQAVDLADQRIKDESSLYKQKALAQFDADLGEKKERALLQLRQEMADAPLNRIGARAREFAGKEMPLEAGRVDPVTTTDGIVSPDTMIGNDGQKIQMQGEGDRGLATGQPGGAQNIAQMKANVLKDPNISDEDKAGIVAQLDRQAAQANSQNQAQAEAAVAGKTRKMTNDEALNAALNEAKISDPVAYEAGLKLAADKTLTVKDGDTILDARTMKPVYSNNKEKNMPAALQEYEYAQRQGYKGSFTDWTTEQKRAGATSLSVNTGQHGFTNALKLREDFKTEPIYKAHQEVQSAYAQIQQSLTKQSPAGDLAGATKIMKLLDPGSVVRESELAMAMAATGALDRLEGYASNVINGTKLNPTQRKDFQELADRLYLESAKQYNAKQGEYRGIAERNGLSIEDVVGKPANLPKREEKAFTAPSVGAVENGYRFKGGDPADPKSWAKSK